MTSSKAIAVDDLEVSTTSGAVILRGVSLSVAEREIVGVVGESGAGKTTVGLALLGYVRPGARHVAGTVRVAGHTMLPADGHVGALRGRLVTYVPQDPATALNPAMRVDSLVRELVKAHRPDLDADEATMAALRRAQLPTTSSFGKRYPHQLSGGQQQRVAIAMALVCEPAVVVLDEPTTGLDVVTQASILDEVRRVRDEMGAAVVYVSHDLAVVGGIADRVAVMYAGQVVEVGPTDQLIHEPRHPYTRALVAAVPDHVQPRVLHGIPGVAVGVGEAFSGCAFAPRCAQRLEACGVQAPSIATVAPGWEVRCLRWADTPGVRLASRRMVNIEREAAAGLLVVDRLSARYRGRDGPVLASDEVSFEVGRGETVALVGASGSGKTTIARCIAGLHRPSSGKLLLDGQALAPDARQRPRSARQRIQIVFQNPYDSLNPSQSIDEALTWVARRLRGLSRRDAGREALAMLGRVQLPESVALRYPRELSGGERQRVALARALIAAPELIVCDEVTSALDVSVQATILELLTTLRAELGLAMLFVTHDLGVVASIADRVLVLDKGRICEEGTVSGILLEPSHPYTQSLLAAAPRLDQPTGIFVQDG